MIMESIQQSIDVEAPLTEVYNQWTQFEEFPRFMEGVKEVRQLGDKRLLWRAEIGGRQKEWTAEIFEQIPDERIAWRSIDGPTNSGMVNFTSLGDGRTRISLKMNYDPEGALENVGDALGVLRVRVGNDLRRFKEFIEARQASTGAWRGTIEGRNVYPDR
jgi:uncharacterized membrane protein